MTIVEFLLARIADDEATHPVYGYLLNVEHHETGCMELAAVERCDAQCDCDGPRRWLAECQAKRAMVEEFGPDLDSGGAEGHFTQRALSHLAAVYDTHPDYNEAWRP